MEEEKSECKEAEVEIKKEILEPVEGIIKKEREDLGETSAVVSSSVNSDTEHLEQEVCCRLFLEGFVCLCGMRG